jgi:hypothetical protein
MKPSKTVQEITREVLNNAWGNTHPPERGEKYPITPPKKPNWKPVPNLATNQENQISQLIFSIQISEEENFFESANESVQRL